ncbi:HAD family hydrolase [Streptomyces sp. NPDC001351]|uniref:HAD family hydrolase n=1 Tax=Streptomyces sp. NPDC001351 TaxID=3364564 RepID=UPI00369D1C86
MRIALIDLDDTLLDYRTEEDNARDAVWSVHLPGIELAVWQRIYDRTKRRLRADGRLPSTAAYTERFRLSVRQARAAGADCPADEAFVRRCEATYWARRDAVTTLLPGAEELLSAVRDQYQEIVLCTVGTTDNQRRRIAAAGLADSFDALRTSEMTGVGKDQWPLFLGPHWRGDAHYLAVSDSYNPDLSSAKRFGMRTAWLRSEATRTRLAAEGLVDVLEPATDFEGEHPAELAALITGDRTGQRLI